MGPHTYFVCFETAPKKGHSTKRVIYLPARPEMHVKAFTESAHGSGSLYHKICFAGICSKR